MKEEKYDHAEAFCLMQYCCKACKNIELLWNSRDGVTPFMIDCPKCGDTAQHINFGKDECFPGYRPFVGQRIFIDLTKERARHQAKMHIDQMREIEITKQYCFDYNDPKNADKLQELVDSYFESGTPPDIITFERLS